MEQLKTFNIEFDRDKEAYHPGDVVGGKILVEFTEPVNIAGIFIRFTGRLYVNLEKPLAENPDQKDGAEKRIFESNLILYSADEPGELVTHPAGPREHPFFYPLPSDLPSSFEDQFGFVRYTCITSINGGDVKDRMLGISGMFCVMRHLDLNQEPAELSCADQQEDWMPIPGCVSSGGVQVIFRVDSRLFRPLDDLEFYVQVKNSSSLNMKAMDVTLMQFVTYDVSELNPHAITQTRETSKVLTKIAGKKIKKKSELEWPKYPLMIPLLPPSRLEGCDCMDVKYFVEFNLKIDKKRSMKFSREIVVGTIPLDVSKPNCDHLAPGKEEAEFLRSVDQWRKSRRQTILSQRGSLHFMVHPAYVIPQYGIHLHAPESYTV